MQTLDINLLRSASVTRKPFPYMILPRFIKQDALARIHADFPEMTSAGSFPTGSLRYGPHFTRLLDELHSERFKQVMGEKLGLDLNGRPTMVTVRGRCRAADGKIHRDSKGKLVTVLLYLNSAWEAEGGRLRLLRSPDDLNDSFAEVPPEEGTMLAFQCAENAWHGHESFSGVRRVIQLNWVVNEAYLQRERRRHRISAFLKRLRALLRPRRKAA